MSIGAILRSLRALHEEIQRDYNARIEGVFGSRARGDEREDSDLDLLVHFNQGATLYDLVGLAEHLQSIFQCKVDVVSDRALREEIEAYVLQELVRI